MSSKLILHRGASRVEREDVFKAPTPRGTDTFCPVPHGQLLRMLDASIERSHYRVAEEEHGLFADGSNYFGVLTLKSTRDDYQTVIGLRNSHIQQFKASLCAGSHVFVCDNLAFLASVVLARKHTKRILADLPALFERAFAKLGDIFGAQEKRFEAYRGLDFSLQEGRSAIVDLAQLGVVPKSRVVDVVAQWESPDHPENADRSGWGLFNAVTSELKGNLQALPNRTEALHGYLDKYCPVLREEILALPS